jgi:hypothetical protein
MSNGSFQATKDALDDGPMGFGRAMHKLGDSIYRKGDLGTLY